MFNNLASENRSIYEIMLGNMAESDQPQITIRRMRFACWITKATNTRSDYVTLYVLPRQHWLSESASLLHSYVHCLSFLQPGRNVFTARYELKL